jgi:hypothetical protein
MSKQGMHTRRLRKIQVEAGERAGTRITASFVPQDGGEIKRQRNKKEN